MARTPTDVPTARTRRSPSDRSRPARAPWCIHQKAPIVAVTTRLFATGAKAGAANRRAAVRRAVATAPAA